MFYYFAQQEINDLVAVCVMAWILLGKVQFGGDELQMFGSKLRAISPW